MAVEHPLRFTPGELLRSAGEIIRQDGTSLNEAVTRLEDFLIQRSPVPLEIQWPLELQNILNPPISLRRRLTREGLRQLQGVIDLYQRHERELTKQAQARLTELLIQRERMTRRLAEMTKFGR